MTTKKQNRKYGIIMKDLALMFRDWGIVTKFIVNNPLVFLRLTLKEKKLLFKLWYHDFTPLGLRTPQKRGHFKGNQQDKQRVLFNYIKEAVALCHDNTANPITGIDLFGADAFYSNFAIQNGVAHITIIDNDDNEIDHGKLITKLLGNTSKIKFINDNVFNVSGSYDIGICAGGLYHISNPYELLHVLHYVVKRVLIIQTIYSLESSSPDYFVTPAPRWTWGCRFSYAHLLKIIEHAGWHTIETTTQILPSNKEADSKGSAYALCVPAAKDHVY